MKAEDRALLFIVVALVAVAAGGAAYVFWIPGHPAELLPVPSGTVFSLNETEHWAAHFVVGPAGGRLLGSWTAYDGYGLITLVVVNGTVEKPWPPPVLFCPRLRNWAQYNGTVNVSLMAGSYTAYWSTGSCSSAAEIVVTQPIQVISS